MTMFGGKRLIALAGIAGSLVLGSVVNASALTVDIYAQVDANPVTLVASGTDAAPLNGSLGFAVPYLGPSYFYGWTLSANASGVGAVGGPPDLLSSGTIDVDKVAGAGSSTLKIWVNEYFLPYTGNSTMTSGFTVNGLVPAFFTVNESTLLNNSTVNSASFNSGDPPNASTYSVDPVTFTGADTLTEYYEITSDPHTGSVTLTITASAVATPLPAALPLFGSVLGGGLLLGRLRKRKVAA